MEYERLGVTLTWQIENVHFIRKLYSPVFSVDIMDQTKWELVFCGTSASDILVNLERAKEDDGPEKIKLLYEFSVDSIEPQEQSLFKQLRYTQTFKKNETGIVGKINMCNREHMVLQKRKEKWRTFFNPETIVIRCKMWKHRDSISKSGYFFARTRMGTQRDTFVGVIENFSDFSESEERALKVISSSSDKRFIKVNFLLFRLCLINVVYGIKIEIIPLDKLNEQAFNFKMFILDSSGNKADIGNFEREFRRKSSKLFVLPYVSKGDLIENAHIYLPNDTLSLHCEITFCSGIEYNKVERAEYESKECSYDTQLQTATETFPAHTNILSAQSPVFEAMFKSDMKETIQKLVNIDDIDAATMKSMLVFLYSDCLDELDWKDTLKLYLAADKYQIDSLKCRCIESLSQSIDISNCCVLILLANMHQDKNLMTAARHWITGYEKYVLNSEEWRNIEKNLPYVAIEILRDLLLVPITFG